MYVKTLHVFEFDENPVHQILSPVLQEEAFYSEDEDDEQ